MQHELKAEALLRAAVAAFNRQGFYQTSLDDIARQLGVTKAALYHYFPNKNALLAACFDRAMMVACEGVETARRTGRNGREKVVLMFRIYLERMIDDLGECMLLIEENALEPKERAELIAQRDEVEHAVRDFIREGISDGSIVSCDPKLATFLLFGAVNWVPKWFLRKGSWEHQQLAEAMTGMLDRMLSTTPAPRLATDIGRKGRADS